MSKTKLNKYLYLQESPIHGRGIYAARDIAAGTDVIQYVGDLIDKDEAERRAEKVRLRAEKTGSGAVYIFTVNDEFDIDGDVPENYARYINHGCVTNCEAVNIEDEIWIEATRNIKKGEELVYDYGFDYSSWDEHPCYCGSKKCVGFIVARRHRKRMMQTKKYSKLINKRRQLKSA